MKIVNFLMLLLGACCLHVNVLAQNWNPIHPEDERIFLIEGSQVYDGFKVDSMNINGADTLYFPPVGLNDYFWDTCTLPNTHWMGDQIVVRSSETIFRNFKGDSIFLRHQATSGTTWEMSRFADSSWVEARVDSLGIDSVYGATDSARYISLQLFDKNNDSLSGVLNGFSMVLFKDHGLVRSPDFRYFPDTVTVRMLVGSEMESAGILNLTNERIFDYDPGDVFHRRSYHRPYFSTWEFSECYYKDSIISYNKTADSIYYSTHTYRACEQNDDEFVYDPYWTFDEEITHTVRSLRSYLDTIPYKKMPDGNVTGMHIQDEHPTIPLMRKTPMNDVYWLTNDTCYTPAFDYEPSYYLECAGGPYYNRSYFSISDRDLLYFNKQVAGKEWGDPVDFVTLSVKEPKFINLSVYPNPVVDVLRISTEVTLRGSLDVTDVYGRQVIVKPELFGKDFSISMHQLPKGLYQVRLLSSQGRVWKTVKVVKE